MKRNDLDEELSSHTGVPKRDMGAPSLENRPDARIPPGMAGRRQRLFSGLGPSLFAIDNERLTVYRDINILSQLNDM